MTITHTFVSGKSDGSDPTLVQPSNWNASHTIANSTITYAMIQNVAAQRLLGNNTGSPAAPAELTASQIFDLVSSTNGVLLTRTAGSWAALANVGTDNGDLLVTANSSPVAPSAATQVKPHVQQFANRAMLCGLAQNNMRVPYQGHLGMRKTTRLNPRFGSASYDFEGITWNTNGTATIRQTTTTSFATLLTRVGAVSAASAGSTCGFYTTGLNGPFTRGASSYIGGWHAVWRFMVSDASLVTTANMFVGVQSTNAVPTDVDPSTLTNLIGVGCTNGDTVMQLYAAGSGAQARTSLGANFPVNTVTTDMYELHLWAPPASSSINYMVTRFNGGGTGDLSTVTGNISAGVNLPSTTTFLYPRAWRSNGGTATAVGIDVLNIYTEQDF